MEDVGITDKMKQTIINKQGAHYVFCPECGSPVIHESGCIVCYSCGWSICG